MQIRGDNSVFTPSRVTGKLLLAPLPIKKLRENKGKIVQNLQENCAKNWWVNCAKIGEIYCLHIVWLWCTNVKHRQYRSIFNHCDVIGLQSYLIQWNKAKLVLLRRSRSFIVTHVGTVPVERLCNVLLVINSYRQPICYHFEVIADCCLHFGHFAF